MQIKKLYQIGRPVISFEVFPPKRDSDVEVIYEALGAMAELSPDFISVTYGAGGGGGRNMTGEIASHIVKNHGVCSMAHLTCVGSEPCDIRQILGEMKTGAVQNVLALRGDLPENRRPSSAYKYAADLIRDIRAWGDFSIGAACYPEGHIACEDLTLDTKHLRLKQEAGADFLITQLFFDNDYFFRFLERARGGGITLPISAGVMPILGRKQIERMIFMCGASLPSGIIRLLYKYENDPDSLRAAGLEYAAVQTEGLIKGGADGVHIYTMNKPEIAKVCAARARTAARRG